MNNNSGGPWGPWGGGENKGENQGNQQPNRPNNKGSEPSFEDLLKKGEDFITKLINGGGSGNNGGGNNQNKPSGTSQAPKSIIGLIILGAILLWLSLGVYKVNSDENAAVLYFGKFYSIATPGLNYHIPYPFGRAIKRSVTTVNNEEFGFSSASNRSRIKRNFDAESLMLTGDENIVDIEFQVQWQISDIENFVFNIAEPTLAIRQATESAMREIIARTPIADVLSDGKRRIELETKDLLQDILDEYKAGVRIVLVQLRRVDPPSQVIDSFRDVQTAKADKEKEINQAQSYSNDIIPRARGTASQMKEESEAYAQEVVSNAEGEAGRFLEVYNQYKLAKRVTRRRMYLETMEKIYQKIDKVYIDNKTSQGGVLPYFPLNDIKSK